MRAFQAGLAFAIVAAFAVPSLAQSLEVRDGSAISIEKFLVEAKVEEGVALVEVDETFRNSARSQLEGVWKFRLPADAVVASFSMWMNGAEKRGSVLEAGRARRIYDSIVRTKKDPGLVEQTGWRDFRVSVFPIPASDTVRIRLRYAYVLPDDLGLETLEIPLPVGCGPVGDLRVHAIVTAARGLATLDCPSHAAAKLVCEATRGEATFAADGARAQMPFVLRAVPKRTGFDVAVVASRPSAGGDGPGEGYFVARVVPRLAEPPKIPRDVVFVIDRSGSMDGRKIEQARAALVSGIASLKPGDRFDVISFASDVTALADGALLPVTDENLARARVAARELTPTGGTNIAGALDAALARRTKDAGRLFAIVFLTDGDPTVGETQPEKILAAWRAQSGGTARLFAFGVGGGVKDFLLTKLAQGSRGSATYVRDDGDLEVKVSALVDSIKTPLLLDPEVSIVGDGVEILNREPSRLPDVFQGRALVVAGCYRGTGTAVLHLRGRSGADAVDVNVPLDFSAAEDRPHVAQIWAKLRVERLLDDLRTSGANTEIRDEIVKLGLRHQIVSPYTSFLVVEDGIRIPDASEEARVPDQGGPPSTGGGGGPPQTGGGSSTGGPSGWANGPRGEMPPDSREPSDPPPPPEAGGPSTPGGEPASGGGGGPSTGGAARSRSARNELKAGYEDWTWWWRYSWDDEIARATAPRVAATPETLAALRAFVRDPSEHFHVRGRAALALAAMDDVEIVPDLVRMASSGSEHSYVIERSLLALGLFPHQPTAARAFLLRRLRDGGPGGESVRPYAAIALGLHRGSATADAETTRALLDVFDATANRESDLATACLLAVGALGDSSAVPRLLEIVRGKSEGGRVLAVEALGKIGRPMPGVVEALAQSFDGKRNVNVARSATGALARISANSLPEVQRRIVDVLVAAKGQGNDETVQDWALVALGRIAGDASTDAAARAKCLEVLDRELAPDRPDLRRAYAALALGVALRAEPRSIRSKSVDEIRARIRAALASAPDARQRAAFVLATGLAGDAASSTKLEAIAADVGESADTRDLALVASALAGGTGSVETIRSRLRADDRSVMAVAAAAAAGRTDFAPDLLAVLTSRDLRIHPHPYPSIARALGVTGDAATVEALRAIAADSANHPSLVRAYAVLAIGRLCGDFGPLDRMTEGINFRAYSPVIGELDGGM